MRRLCYPLLPLILFFISPCVAKTSRKAETSEVSVQVSSSSRKNRSFFGSVNKEALSLIEIGSPSSLTQGVRLLHKGAGEDYSEAEKTLLFVSSKIMEIVWPSEKITWDIPQDVKPNQYTGAVESAEKGIYDLSTNGSDFLSTLLPCLALITGSENVSEYYGEAEKALSTALTMNNGSVLAHYLFGVLFRRKGETEKSLEHFKSCNGRYAAGNKEIMQGIAEACFVSDNFELALSFGEELLSRFPQDLGLLKLCAESSYKLKDFDRTESFVIRILLLEPDNISYVLLRASILLDKKDYVRSSSLLDACEKKNTTTKEYFILRSRLQLEFSRNSNAAVETLGIALSLYPNDIDVLLAAAETSCETGSAVNGQSALSLADKVLSLESDNIRALTIALKESMKSADFLRAYSISSRLMQIPSAKKSTIYSHVEVCIALKKQSEAMSVASEAYKKDPSDVDACMAYIKALSSSGQSSSAMQLIESLLPGSDSNLKSFLYCARSELQESEEAALSDLRLSLTSNPRNKDALYSLYLIYYGKKDWRRAQYYLKQVVALEPSNPVYIGKNTELERLLGK